MIEYWLTPEYRELRHARQLAFYHLTGSASYCPSRLEEPEAFEEYQARVMQPARDRLAAAADALAEYTKKFA